MDKQKLKWTRKIKIRKPKRKNKTMYYMGRELGTPACT
jgi:hypothetical protein